MKKLLIAIIIMLVPISHIWIYDNTFYKLAAGGGGGGAWGF